MFGRVGIGVGVGLSIVRDMVPILFVDAKVCDTLIYVVRMIFGIQSILRDQVQTVGLKSNAIRT